MLDHDQVNTYQRNTHTHSHKHTYNQIYWQVWTTVEDFYMKTLSEGLWLKVVSLLASWLDFQQLYKFISKFEMNQY